MAEGLKQGDVSSRRQSLARTGRPGGAIAITGVNTYLGRSLVALLERDRRWRRIVAIDLKNAPTAGPKTRYYKIDLTQPAVEAQLAEILHAEKVDTFVHGAFLSSPTHAIAWAHELESVGTMHVLGACEEYRVRKFILSSHTMLYGARPSNHLYLSEEHSLKGDTRWPFIADKIDAEKQTASYAKRAPNTIVSVLRAAPTVGPTVSNLITDLLRQRVIPTVMGYDPLVQLVHELDVVASFRIAINEDHPGIFNIVGPGVLPLTSIVRLAGRLELWVPHFLVRSSLALLHSTHLARPAPMMLDYFKYPCVACGEKAAEQMGFRASYSTREALGDFARVLRRFPKTERAAVNGSPSTQRGM